jgi:hypothetical protein
MLQDSQLPPDFEAVTEPGEKILWTGRPVFWPFVLHAVPMVLFGAIWGAMDLGIFGRALSASNAQNGQSDLFLYIFGFLHSFPAWGSVLYAIYLVMVHSNTLYAYKPASPDAQWRHRNLFQERRLRYDSRA